jgi:hypothetical protein
MRGSGSESPVAIKKKRGGFLVRILERPRTHNPMQQSLTQCASKNIVIAITVERFLND